MENIISNIQTDIKSTDNGVFRLIDGGGYHKNLSEIGRPDLPVMSKLIEIPQGASLNVEIIDYSEHSLNLDNLGIEKIMPVQASYPKSVDLDTVEMAYDADFYAQDQFTEYPLVHAEVLGTMRGVRMARIDICPFEYNPVSNELIVKTDLRFAVEFEGGNTSLTSSMKNTYYSPDFEPAYSRLLNYTAPASKDEITSHPIKYVIVSDAAFESSLQPFVEWKTMSGYNVIEAYTGGDVSNSTSSIYNYLESLYNAGSSSDPAPTYVLFVGDHDNLTAWDGETGSHITDLYYCTYDGDSDYLPEMYFGRLSAESTSELQNALDKIIPYEKYELPSGDFLNECVMVAGVDNNFAPSHGDGQIYYGINEYYNESHEYTDIYAYYYSLTSGPYHVMSSNSGEASGDIISKISNGVGFANYTAHCDHDGWADPSFSRSDISGLGNTDEYPLMIGNCCLSNEFDQEDAFGEMIVYAQDKGAIGYIGGTNSTYWDEDFWWGVGVNSLSITESNADEHTYANTNIGAYDGNWHENGEAWSNWHITARQMAHCGNLAVTEAGSSLTEYYWEIYQLFGDPSLLPYMTSPEALTVNYSAPMTGASSMTVNTEPYTYVAISQDGTLWDAKWSGSNSSVTLEFSAISNSNPIDIVATKQNKVPHIEQVTAIPPDPPTADFSASPTTIYEGETVDFTDESQYATSWDWDFGDGQSATAQNPSHTYTTAGTYTVSLTVSNSQGDDTETKTDYITVNVNTNPPTVDFSADQTTINVGGTVQFSDMTANNPDSWTWTFDGGTPSSSPDQNPSVTYNTAGTYDVSLFAENQHGDDELTKTDYINVILDYCDAGSNETSQGEYIANLELEDISNSSGNSSYTDFTDISTDLILGQSYPIEVMNGYDQYDQDKVLVWIDLNIDGDFDDSGEQVWESAVGTGTPFSGNISAPASADIGQTRMRIRLFDTQNGANSTPCGNSDWGEVEDYTVNLISPDIPPTADFTAEPTETCDGLVQFTDQSLLAGAWEWDFGDGTSSTEQNPQHQYTEDGTYTVSLTVTNEYGEDTYEETDYILVDMPEAPDVTGAESCGPGEMTLQASGSGGGELQWFENETGGSPFNTGQSYTDNFDITTTFYVAEQFTGTSYNVGKTDDSDNGQFYTADNTHGLVFDALTDITINSVKVYADGAGERTIKLLNSSDEELQSTTVNIPDGENVVDLNFSVPSGTGYKLITPPQPNLYYNQQWTDYPYPYEVTDVISITGNTVGDDGYYLFFYNWEVQEGSNCVSPRIPVTATVHSLPEPDLGGDQTICVGEDITLDAGSYDNFEWNTGAGSQTITVSEEGDYMVTVTDINGCIGEDGMTLTVAPLPDASIDPVSDLCETDAPVELIAVTSGGEWSGEGVSNGFFNPAIAGAGTHTIMYEVENGSCSASSSIDITVLPAPEVELGDDIDLCAGSEAEIDAGPGYEDYQWSTQEDSQSILVVGEANYSVTVTNAEGCTASDDVYVTVHELPEISLSMTPESNDGSADGTASVEIISGNEPYSFSWDNGGDTPTITGLAADNYCVTVTDATGCTASDCIEVSSLGGEVSANFTAEPVSGCFPLEVSFTNLSQNANTYSWNFGDGSTSTEENPVHQYTSEGTFTVQLTASDGTTEDVFTETDYITVGAPPEVEINVTNASGADVADGSAEATVTGGTAPYDYLWSNGDTDPVMENVLPGQYSLMVTDAFGCMVTEPVVIDFIDALGTQEASFSIYPNPADKELLIELNNLNPESIEIVNMLGQLVKTTHVQSDKIHMNVSELNEGMYFVRIVFPDTEKVHKIMIR